MDTSVKNALQQDRLIDITTVGRKTGKSRRIEIGFHYIDGVIYISGRPGKRDWYANMSANPNITLHLKQSIQLDILAKANPIVDLDRRKEVIPKILAKRGNNGEIDSFIEGSPLIETQIESQDEN